ncbi:MAG TPA: heme peroxidase family protein [Solirubrobacteraceae bacterium]|nr:heme peroxidase family protein [Solirubrobacteraceae bacterium]
MTTAPAACHGLVAPRGQDARASGQGGRFGRMFALPRDELGDEAIEELVRVIAARPQKTDNDAIPAGYTYLGQFVDHDITFDPTSKLERDNDPLALVNFRTPRLDLDSLYGTGPSDQPFLYEWAERRDRGVKLLVGRPAAGEGRAAADLPRNEQGVALIGDPRNDENAIVSQLHLLFVRFHNAVVDHVRHERPALEGGELFEEARRLVRWHYQWIVAHDFLARIVGRDMAGAVLRDGEEPGAPAVVERRHFAWRDQPYIPVEFSGAAYRFGHSMVRSNYFTQRGRPAPAIFPPHGGTPGENDLSGARPLLAALALQWELFFWEQPVLNVTNSSMRINNRITKELLDVPGRGALPRLNLRRGRALGLPRGQDVAAAMGEPPLPDAALGLDPRDPAGVNERLRRTTPLWYYVLCEAGTRERGGGGAHLGPVGGRIVAEVLVGLLEADPQSYLSVEPGWRPVLPSRSGADFTMIDLVDFAARA